MSKPKIAWLSRHPLGPDRLESLEKYLGVNAGVVEVVPLNVTWAASADESADFRANGEIWGKVDELLSGSSIVCGVFPPVALERCPDWLMLLSPVSRQCPEKRVGEGPIPFEHLRWARVK